MESIKKYMYCVLLFAIPMTACLGQNFSKSYLYNNDHSFDVHHAHHFSDSSKMVIYLPSVRFGLSQKGPKITDYVSRTENGVLLLNPNAAVPFAKDQNIVQSGGQINGLGFAMRLNPNVTIAASYGIKYVTHVDYPLQALDLYTAGNAFIFGEELDLSFKTTAQGYHNYSIAANYIKDRFTVGIQFSLLSGIGDISVDRDKLLLEVAPLFYNITTDTDFRINTTDLLQYESFERIIIDYTGDFGKSFFSSNRGISFSFSAAYDINTQTSINFGVSDIGSIKWKSNPVNYGTSGIKSFDGVSILDLINPDVIVSYQDSLEQLLDIQESQFEYKTNLPVSYNLGVNHIINDDLSISGSAYYNSFSSFTNYAIGIAGHYNVTPQIALSGAIHHSPLQTLSFGIGGSLGFGIVDFFAYTNNVLSILNQTDAAFTYGSIGMNLNFGRVGYFRKDSGMIKSQK